VFAAAHLAACTREELPLVWAERLLHRYAETRHPDTGLGGYQFSQMAGAWCTWNDDGPILTGDRAQYQYGEDFPGHLVLEGTLFPCYGSAPAAAPLLAAMASGDLLGAAGQTFSHWATQELAAWGRVAYRPSDHSFVPMLTDGTSMEGYVCRKDGYFGPAGRVLTAGRARAEHFWAYAVAYRQTGDPFLWKMARSTAIGSGSGDIGEAEGAAGGSSFDTDVSAPQALLGFLELYRRTGHLQLLLAAQRIGDNLLRRSFHLGLFLASEAQLYARFDAIEPLALLHLAAALEGKPDVVPAYPGGRGFYASAYGSDKGSTHRYDESLYARTRS